MQRLKTVAVAAIDFAIWLIILLAAAILPGLLSRSSSTIVLPHQSWTPIMETTR